MNDPAFKTAAYILAEKTPLHLGKPTMPPQGWVLEGANLVVLLADGRKVRGPIIDQKRENIVPAKGTQNIQMVYVPATHIHDNKPSSPKGKKK